MTATTNHNTGAAGESEGVMDFSKIQAGLLPTGTVTPLGTVEDTSLTAYRMASGEWVAFRRVHGTPAPVEGLVTFADGSRYGGRR